MTRKLIAASLIALASLGAGVFPVMAQTTTPQSTVVAQPAYCVVFTKNLYRGVRDDQVSTLQQFLANQGYTQSITGYFGPLTWGNLMRFQHSRGILASGYFGPLTRAAIASICGGGTVGGLTVTSPTQGQIVQNGSVLPISWSYATSSPNVSVKIELYTASGASVGLIAVSNSATSTYTWTVPPFPNNRLCMMIYPNGLCGASLSGQYYVQVRAVSGMGFDQNATVYASGRSGVFTITNASSTDQSNVSASPTSGAAPLRVTFTPGANVGTYAINFGDGTSASLLTGTTTHTYSNRGTYTATFTSDLACMHTNPRCMIATRLLGSVVITVN